MTNVIAICRQNSFGIPLRCDFVLRAALVVLTALFCIAGPVHPAFSQDEDAAAEFGEDPGAPEDAAGGPDPAGGVMGAGGADAGGDNNAGGEEDAAAPSDSLLGLAVKSLGITYMAIFLILSVTLVSLFVMNMLAARRETLCPNELIESFEEKLNAKEYQGSLRHGSNRRIGSRPSPLGGPGENLPGLQQSDRGECRKSAKRKAWKLEHRLSYMALIGNLSPMIGLFGTVQGMISSFRVIATSPQTPKPSQLAEGISTALFTTLVGLAIAIPAIAAYNILRNRVARLLLEVGVQSENLMSRFDDGQPGRNGSVKVKSREG